MSADAEEVIALSKRIVDLELRRDAEGLAALIRDDYLGIDPSGAVITKTISVGRYRNPEFKLFDHRVSVTSVRIFGDTAVEIGTMLLRGKLGTFSFGGTYRYTHVWVRSAGGWQVASSQLTQEGGAGAA